MAIAIRTMQKVFHNACERGGIRRKVGVHVLRPLVLLHIGAPMWKLLDLFIAHKIVRTRRLRSTALYAKAWWPSLRIQGLVL
jgi:hypothetical protein